LGPHTDKGSAAYLITGGDDRHIRVWDLHRPNASYTMSGVEAGEPEPSYGKVGATHFCRSGPSAPLSPSGATVPQRERRGPVPPPLCHNDAVTDLAITNLPCRLLLSSSRDGIVKVWR
jgi:phosphoinositide-3-kinase regulatory subunit 4